MSLSHISWQIYLSICLWETAICLSLPNVRKVSLHMSTVRSASRARHEDTYNVHPEPSLHRPHLSDR